ncbi:hypothetical protein P1X14_18650 [Sphingomonas sp. AOB5]|uniref:hypothetical protein n=1 Tax=Sphingomonas sp. AOB5 TaxID=3034017 RepID=UPI0023F7CA93|nr:hypothetical protein [Sphingomonas sp. AOB5]MDF7777287.1 hypothetical protein [Sphingomonas sp. AOB5]
MRGAVALLLGVLAVAPAHAQSGAALPVPTGVNGTVLGTPEAFAVKGPGRICSNRSGFELLEGETAYLEYMGIHTVRFSVRSSGGEIGISEGDTYADPRHRGRPIRLGALNAYRLGSGSKRRYAIYAPPESSEGDERLLIWVRNLRGRDDMAVLKRITLDPRGSDCTQRFVYGFFFEESESD